MNKRRNILFLITIFVLLLIKAAHAEGSGPVPTDPTGQGIEDTAHGVATTGLIFVAIIGSLLAAMRIRATHLRQQNEDGGPQQLGLSQLSAKHPDHPR
jgi:Na+/glutamate symporter